MGCSSCTSTPINVFNPEINEFNEITEIETFEDKSFQSFNSDYQFKKDKNGIMLNYLSQYYLYPKKKEVLSKYSNQIIMITGKDINPFKLNENNNEIKKAISKSKEIITKFKDKIIPISPCINVNQHIFPDYHYTIELNSNSKKKKKIYFNKCFSLLFILFNQKSILKKIKEIKKYEENIKKSLKEEETFELILMVKEDKEELKKILISNNIKDFYILTKKEENFMKSFGLNDIQNSKCIFYDKTSEIGLILDDNIEYLNEEMIKYYFERNSEKKYNKYNNENKQNLK